MKCISGLALALVVIGSPLAFSETVTYQGNFNDNPITLTFNVARNFVLVPHYIPCQTRKDEPCSGPGTYAFFYQDGTVTLTYLAKTEVANLNLAYYVGEDDAKNGQLNAVFKFSDRTNLPTSVDEYDRMRGYQFSLYQYGGVNPIMVSASNNSAVLSFPATYLVNWSLANSKNPRGYDFGSIPLARCESRSGQTAPQPHEWPFPQCIGQ